MLFYFICTYSDLWWNLWKFGIGCWICWASKIQESCLMIIIDWDFFFVFQDTVYLVLLQVPKCFELVQIFCARPKIYLHIVAVTNILCHTQKNDLHSCLVLLRFQKCFELVQIFCASPKMYSHIVAITKILCQTKRWFAFSKIGFCAGTKVFE